jgi:hypothetical protein
MEILVLIAQRKCQYPGQYAPEALAVISECDHSDNPDYMRKELADAKADSDLDAVAVVSIKVDSDAIDAILFPESKPLTGTVKPISIE